MWALVIVAGIGVGYIPPIATFNSKDATSCVLLRDHIYQTMANAPKMECKYHGSR